MSKSTATYSKIIPVQFRSLRHKRVPRIVVERLFGYGMSLDLPSLLSNPLNSRKDYQIPLDASLEDGSPLAGRSTLSINIQQGDMFLHAQHSDNRNNSLRYRMAIAGGNSKFTFAGISILASAIRAVDDKSAVAKLGKQAEAEGKGPQQVKFTGLRDLHALLTKELDEGIHDHLLAASTPNISHTDRVSREADDGGFAHMKFIDDAILIHTDLVPELPTSPTEEAEAFEKRMVSLGRFKTGWCLIRRPVLGSKDHNLLPIWNACCLLGLAMLADKISDG